MVRTKVRSTRSNYSECTYILRFVELNHRGEKNPWSPRQFLVFQRFSPSTIWIFVALSKSMRRELQSYLSRSTGLPRDPFIIHLILINAAAATWRGYLVYIAEELRELVWETSHYMNHADRNQRQIVLYLQILAERASTWPSLKNANI